MTKKKNHGKLKRSRRQLALLPKCNASRARTRTGKWKPVFLRALATTPSITARGINGSTSTSSPAIIQFAPGATWSSRLR